MRKRRWGIVLVVAILAGAGIWWALRRPPAVATPPEVTSSDPRVASAIADARAQVLARPKDGLAWGRMGQTLLANGLTDPARDCFAQAALLDPNEARWPYLEGISLLLRDPVAAIPCWQRAAEHAKGEEAISSTRLRWAEALLANDRLAEAEPILKDELAKQEDSARVHFDLGTLAAARDNPATAINHFRLCLNDPATRQKAASRLASLCSRQGKTSEAAAFAAQAEHLPRDADWPDPYMAETVFYAVGRDALFIQAEEEQQSGNVAQAMQMYDEVIRRYPDEVRAYAKIGLLLVEQGNYGGAEQVVRRGLQADPNNVQCLFLLSAALFQQAEKRGFEKPESQLMLRDAATSAGRAVAIKPDHGFAHLYRGLALLHLGKQKEALASLRESVRCTPEEADPHLHLGEALWAAGRKEEGKTELEQAIRLAGPKDKRPQAALDRLQKEDAAH